MTTNTTRRAVMAGLAAAPVAGIPGATSEADAAVNGDEKLMTTEDFAAFEFEPWRADLLALCEPPNNEKWEELSLQHLIFIRLAWAMLHQTKQEIIDRWCGADDEAGILMIDGVADGIRFHQQAVDILTAAQSRILVAGSFLEVNEWEPQS
jgi:hypothetical protein